MSDLPRVNKGEAITADAWNQIVDSINGASNVSITRSRRRIPNTITFRRVYVTQEWKTESGIWASKAQFYKGNRRDTSVTIDIYAPVAEEKPSSNVKMYVTQIDGQWCTIERFRKLPKVVAGTGIKSNTSNNDYNVSNDGVLKIADARNQQSVWIKGNVYIGGGLALTEYHDSVHTDGTPPYDGICVMTTSQNVITEVQADKTTVNFDNIAYVKDVSVDSEGKLKLTYGYANIPILSGSLVTDVVATNTVINGVNKSGR